MKYGEVKKSTLRRCIKVVYISVQILSRKRKALEDAVNYAFNFSEIFTQYIHN